jgi:hypothetical protein
MKVLHLTQSAELKTCVKPISHIAGLWGTETNSEDAFHGIAGGIWVLARVMRGFAGTIINYTPG